MNKYLLTLFVVASAIFVSGCATVQESSPTAWEYKIIDGRVSTTQEKGWVEDALNNHADEGWIVSSSSAVSTAQGTRESMFIILKRPKDP